MLDIINRLDQPSWHTPPQYPQGPSLSVYFLFLAFTLISPSITNIQYSCERFSRESDAGSPRSVTTGVLTCARGRCTVLPQQQDGRGGQRGKPTLDLVSLPSQAQLLSHLKFNLPSVLVYGCSPQSPCGHSHGAGVGAGSSAGSGRLVCGCRAGIFLGGTWETCAFFSTAADGGTTAHVSYNDPAPP